MAFFAVPLLVVLLIASAVVWWRRRARAGRGDLATCGHCGYAVTGLTTFTCPECGSDLREVGIVRGRNAPPGLPGEPRAGGEFVTFFRVVGWKMALFAGVFAVAAYFGIDHYVDRVHPTTWVDTQVVRLTPRSGAYKSVAVTLTERYVTRGYSRPPGSPVSKRRADVELTVGPNRFTFTRDVFDGTNTYLDSKGAEQSNRRPLSDELAAWMADHGVDPTSAAVRGEIDTLAGAITQSNQQGEFWELLANRSERYFNRETAYSSHAIQGNPRDWGVYGGAAAIVLGLAGLAVIWTVNRARLGEALAAARARMPATPPLAQSVVDGPPAAGPSVRTLSVMFSDVKDYTARTAQESRLGILDLVRRHRDLARPIVKRRGGRIVKSLGDGLLIVFESATDAVLSGLEIQAAAAAHSRDARADRDKVELRIGVSTGEVATDGGDVFGEAVNLASRAQQQAGAGDVLFTEATCATINRREVRFADAGTFELKGVAEPVRLYRAVDASAGAVASAVGEDAAGKPAR
jgi:class 3 adenylate cyclase/predicted RNA-binding Zn-ribbon protein involved in translation (DUF1610 family)